MQTIRSGPDVGKALEVLLYVAQSVPDMYHALKVIYFADKQHLAEYGRLIYGDSYVAMRLGPVPSVAYDIGKQVRGDGWCVTKTAADCLEISGNSIVPRRKARMQLLSESERECLDAAIETYGNLPVSGLINRSHDAAWESADQNDLISIEEIARSIPNSEALLDYLKNG